jgi:hypothetical protein
MGARIDQQKGYRSSLKNENIRFAKPDSPIFTEKPYAQSNYQKRSRAFLGMIKMIRYIISLFAAIKKSKFINYGLSTKIRQSGLRRLKPR